MLNMEQLWRSRLDNPLYNTSYPLSPSHWSRFRVRGALPLVGSRCAFYIHVPFCGRLCSFCEYTRMVCPQESLQLQYIDTLTRDVAAFVAEHPEPELYGFDIGGGTPTILSDAAFEHLMQLVSDTMHSLRLSVDFEPSIEGTFQSITPRKLAMLSHCGIHRLSLGLQSTSPDVLGAHNRSEISLSGMHEKIAMARDCGIRKLNLDLMYGLAGQTEACVRQDLEILARLRPEQVTLYEWRTNMLRSAPPVSPAENYRIYSMYYQGLRELGYHAGFGQNTFSKDASDYGCSSYLRHRMLSAAPYKGFGISAQSMSEQGISYNIGKNAVSLPLSASSYEEQEHYLLPRSELAAKYISIAAYYGAFSLTRLSEILGCSAEAVFASQIQFVLQHQLMHRQGDSLCITPEGYRHYGATFSLFSSPKMAE